MLSQPGAQAGELSSPYGLRGKLIRLGAENTLSTVDQGHREMISIMKAFNSSAVSRREVGRGQGNCGKMLQERSSILAPAWVGDISKARAPALKGAGFWCWFPGHSFTSNYMDDNTNDRPSDLDGSPCRCSLFPFFKLVKLITSTLGVFVAKRI